MSSPIMRVANNEKGVFTYSPQQAVFGIKVDTGVNGNAFYIICNLPTQLPSLNDSVSFSGNIRISAFQSQIGGQTFYELQPTSIVGLKKK
ncbi:MAG TPA: hypothetical protein VFQ86_08305 [Arachidicoccus soli]|nr:hypothetical protein [Arachidicoccus soli]HEU0227725.1 hypothetical protein [Arachidicoccus soli]